MTWFPLDVQVALWYLRGYRIGRWLGTVWRWFV